MPDTALDPINVRATIDGLRLAVLRAVPRNDWCLSLGRLAVETKVPREICRGIVAELRSDGLVTYRKGLFNEDGEVAGSGYTLTPRGEAFLEEHRK